MALLLVLLWPGKSNSLPFIFLFLPRTALQLSPLFLPVFLFHLSSHTGETGGAFLSSHSVFFCLPGIRFGHRPGHSFHQPLRGTFSMCHLRGALFFSMHAALLSAV